MAPVTGGVGCEEVAEELGGAGDLDGRDADGEAGARLGLLLRDAPEEPGYGCWHKPRLPAAGSALTAAAAAAVPAAGAAPYHRPRFTQFGVAEGQDAAVGAVDDGRDDVAQHRPRHVHLAGK